MQNPTQIPPKKPRSMKLVKMMDKTAKGIFRASFLVSLVCALFGAFIWAPYRSTPIAKEIKFTNEDKEQFKTDVKKNQSYYTEAELDKYSKNIINYYKGESDKNGKVMHLYISSFGDRNGKVSLESDFDLYFVPYVSTLMYTVVNRTIDYYDYIDFSGGWVVQNKKYGLPTDLFDKDGYSIVPGFKAEFFNSFRHAWICGLMSWIAIGLVLPGIIIFLGLWMPIFGSIISLILGYFKWVRKGFSNES